MPEMTFTVRWPDGQVQQCYSPSLVMHDYLEIGSTYTVADFTTRSTTALAKASDRVREKFGFACTSASATSDDITDMARRHPASSTVEVLGMHPPLPTAQIPTT